MRFERTGEWRVPRRGEWYEASAFGEPMPSDGLDTERWILREVGEEKARPETAEVLSAMTRIYYEVSRMFADLEPEYVEAKRRVRVWEELVGFAEGMKQDKIPGAKCPPEVLLRILHGD